ESDDGVRRFENVRWTKGAAVGVEGGAGRRRAEMRGKGVAGAELAGGGGAGAAGAEQVDRWQGHAVGYDPHRLEWMAVGKAVLLEGKQLCQLLGEVFAAEGAERPQGLAVGAAGAAEPEIDTAGEEPGQRPVGFDDAQRYVVGEHDAAGADADAAGGGGGAGNQDVR